MKNNVNRFFCRPFSASIAVTIWLGAAVSLRAAPLPPPSGPLPGAPRPNLPSPNRPLPNTPIPTPVACPERVEVAFPETFSIPTVLSRGDHDLKRSGVLGVTVAVRASKRRLFIEGTMMVQERRAPSPLAAQPGGSRPPIGDTRYVGSFHIVSEVRMPANCEIASYERARGTMSGGPNRGGSHVFYGAGVLDQAACVTEAGHDLPPICNNVRLQTIVVRTRPLRKTCGSPTIRLPVWSMRLEQVTQGDDDLYGHRPHVHIDADVQRSATQARLRLRTQIREDQSDWTTLAKEDSIELFDVDLDAPGCRIRAVAPLTGRLRGQTARSNDHEASIYGTADSPNPGPLAEGMIEHARCRTDADGGDRLRVGCGEISLRPITVTLEKVD